MKKFLDCISIVGATPSKFHGTKKYVSTGAVATTEIDESEVVEVTYEDRPSRANLSAEAGDILFAKMQGTRKTLLLDSETEENIYSTGFYAVRANPEVITTECLYYLIDSELFLAQKDKNCSGATQKAITNGGMAKIEISVPALSEQGILVNKLKHLTQLIADKKKQLNLFDEIIKSRFIELFGTETELDKWHCGTVSDVADVCVGVVIKPTQYYTDIGIPAFRSLNIGEMCVKDADWVYFTEEGHQKNQKSVVRENDVLVVRSGAPGTACVASEKYAGYNAVDIIIAHPDNKKVNSVFLAAFTNMPHGMNQIRAKTGGAAQQHFNVGGYKAMRLIMPPLKLQEQFAAFVEQTDKSKFEIQQSLEKLEILKKSLMQQYFG